MRKLLILLLAAVPLHAQSTSAGVYAALVGRWSGVLEYRDYSEPATSTRRVQLPTWLTVRPAPEGVFFDYVYDDGPGKTVTAHNALVIDLAAATYRVMGTDEPIKALTITTPQALKDGRGELVLTGTITENKAPAELRTTLTIRRNLLTWLEETRPLAAAGEPPAAFAFRHRYVFVRAEAPPVPAAATK